MALLLSTTVTSNNNLRGDRETESTITEPSHEKTNNLGFRTRPDTNRPVVQSKIEVEDDLYYPCSENKGTDQL